MAPNDRGIVKQLVTAAVVFAVGGFVVAGGVPCAVLAAQPVCNVVISPGPTPEILGNVTVSGTDVYPPEPSSRVTMATIAVTERIGWRAYVTARRSARDDVTLRTAVFPDGESRTDTNARNTAAMRESQRAAELAAYRVVSGRPDPQPVGVEILAHTDRSVLQRLPAKTVLVAINDTPVTTVSELTRRLQVMTAGSTVTVTSRDGQKVRFTLPDGEPTRALGVYLTDAHELPFTVTVDAGVVGGPSAGLLFGVAIVEQLVSGSQIGALNVSGTGTLDRDGTVGPVGGVKQKLFAAGVRESTVDVFFLPEANRSQLAYVRVERDLLVVVVTSLQDTLDALAVLQRGGTPERALTLRP